MTKLSPFLESCRTMIPGRWPNIIRISEVYRDGEIRTLECMSVSPCQDVYSVAKTFTMTAVGLMYDKGLVRLNEKVCDILSDELPPSGMDERWRTSTVEMALMHRLGLPSGFLDIDVNPSSEFTHNFLHYLFTYPLAYEPDTEWRYSDGAYYLLARIVEKRAGMPLENFLWQEMLFDMGFQELAWSHCPLGHAIGATGLYVHSADMVKLGMLYLNGGVYRGKRLLSSKWTNLAVSRCYGLNPYGGGRAYGKGGMYGQELLILPDQKRVVAIQSFGNDPEAVNEWMLGYGDRV